jgi:tetratricopeptide (TPR) repeat protein
VSEPRERVDDSASERRLRAIFRTEVVMSSSLIRRILLAFVVLSVVACQSDEEKFADHLKRGDEYFEAGQYSEAIIEYKNVLQVDPNAGEVHYKLSKAYMKNGKVREGFWELRETVRLDETNIEAKIQLAQMLFLGKELEEGLAQIDEAILAEPENPAAHVVRAQILFGLNRGEESLVSYARAVEVAPGDDRTILLYASALENAGDIETASTWFAKLIEVAPTFRSYVSYGEFIARRRDPSRDAEVEGLMKNALAVAEPEELPRAYGGLAGFYYSRDRVDEAIAALEEGVEKSEEKLDLIYTLARFHSSQGNEEKADALIEQATEASPNEARPYLILSAYRDRKGDYEGALAAARKAVEIEPENESARLREAEVVIEIGVREKDQEKVDEGRALVEELLAQDPDHAAGLLVRSKIDLYEENVDAAVAALRTAINARPEWAQAHFVLGTALAMKGDETGARSELARALEIDASLLQARRVLAQVHAGLRENEYAVEEGRRYLREMPGDVQLRILVAQSLIRLGKVDEAERELSAISEEGRNAEVHYAYGRIRMGQRNLEEARTHLLAALEERPASSDIINSLYLIDRTEGRVDETVERIETGIEAEPENARLYALRGNVALAQKRGADAEADFKKAIDLEPNDLRSYESLARYYASTGRLDEAIDTYESAVKVRPKAAQLYHLLGVLYELAGKPDQAIKNYEAAIRYQPNLGEAKNNLAYLLAEKGEDLDRALDLAQEAKALLPDSANAADTLGWVLYKRGVASAAISYLKEAEAASDADSPSTNVIRYHLALAYEKNEQNSEAVSTLERALSSLDGQLEAARKSGGSPQEPDWAADARGMLDRLRTS